MSLSDVFKKTFNAVGPARTAGYALQTAALMRESGTADEHVEARHAASLSRLKTAHDMLSTGVLRMLRNEMTDEDGEMDAELEVAREKALTAVEAVMSGMSGGSAATGVSADLIGELDDSATDYIQRLDKFTTDVEQARDASRSASTMKAVAEIRKISASINLIAVNASIEAARAGDAGKGFGVIAAEIQALSRRSQEALETIGAQH